MVYTNNMPLANQQIATTQPLIEGNFNFLQNGIGVEHNFNVACSGSDMYHKFASMPNASPDPPTLTAGAVGAYYVSGGQARFWDGTNVSQLTLANPATNGYQWLGRVLIQWGFVSASFPIGGTTLTFATNNIAFPNNCFVVFTNITYTGTAPGDLTKNSTIVVGQVSKTSFKYISLGTGTSSQQTGFYWTAIGD